MLVSGETQAAVIDLKSGKIDPVCKLDTSNIVPTKRRASSRHASLHLRSVVFNKQIYYILIDNVTKVIYIMQDGQCKVKSTDLFYSIHEELPSPDLELLKKTRLPFLNGPQLLS